MGTWVAYATGRVLVGKHSSGTFDALNEELGAETTTLTVANLPSHTHTINSLATNSSGSVVTTDSHSVGGGNHTTDATGGGTGHSNLQPSVTVHMWKRTA